MKALWIALLTMALAGSAEAAPVLLISIDGLRVRDVTDAPGRGMALPSLRAFLTEGSYADGVRDMLPSITYPNHTSLITGVAPALHGISSNQTFDPFLKNMEGWYWYSSDIKVPTLWDAVHASGGLVANFGWPVSVGSPAIGDNVPEYWRARTLEDIKLVRALSTPGLLDRLERISGVTFAQTFGLSAASDTARTRIVAALLAADHPAFTTLHLVSFDETEHNFGPDSAEAKTNLQALDKAIGGLAAAARAAMPGIVIAVVSDHGFAPISQDVNLMTAFVGAGFVTLDPKSHAITHWDAEPWYGAGSSLIVLAHPDDAAMRDKVAALLAKLAADPANGIGRVIDRPQIAARGGAVEANFFVEYAPGYKGGKAVTGPLITPSSEKGSHGYFPDRPEMRATFLIKGPGIAPGRDLGEIDMRDIAPTLAKIMGVGLPTATGKPLF